MGTRFSPSTSVSPPSASFHHCSTLIFICMFFLQKYKCAKFQNIKKTTVLSEIGKRSIERISTFFSPHTSQTEGPILCAAHTLHMYFLFPGIRNYQSTLHTFHRAQYTSSYPTQSRKCCHVAIFAPVSLSPYKYVISPRGH